ncbi:MAG TPA: DUF1343 domain-containing protein [Limnochordia bacterium]|nr:DUF1343 domain-containing protein [Limnochordia bacterium]
MVTAASKVVVGLETFLNERLDLVRGRRVGLLTAPAAVDSRVRHSVRLLRDAGVKLTALFGPEHGLYGDAQAGVAVGDATDPLTGLPVFSLYGQTRRPTSQMLGQIDVLVCDLVDGGARYWTHLYSMAYALEAAAAHGVEFVVLDRPNPIGGAVLEGNLAQPGYFSFVGAYPLPMRHGFTMGEMARWVAARQGLAAPTVVAARGWRRAERHAATGLPWVPPSPNIPAAETFLLYPGTCFVEGTTASEGRGTTRPFEWIGHPGLDAFALADRLNACDLAGVAFRPAYFRPTFSKHAGELCAGVQIHVLEPEAMRPVAVGVHLLKALHAALGEALWRSGERPFIDLLGGGPDLRTAVERGEPADALLARWAEQRAPFERACRAFWLYA